MSENLLEDGKVYVSAVTGPAFPDEDDRARLQLTIADRSDAAQLSRDEVRALLLVLDEWLHESDARYSAGVDWAVPPAPWMDDAVSKNDMLLDIPLRVWLGQRHVGKRSISTTAADFLRLLGLPPDLFYRGLKKDYRVTVTPFDVEY